MSPFETQCATGVLATDVKVANAAGGPPIACTKPKPSCPEPCITPTAEEQTKAQ